MNTAVEVADENTALVKIDHAVFRGDFSKLTDYERDLHVKRICKDLDINPSTGPIKWIMMNGKLVPYAGKDCSDQLRKKHNISVAIVERSEQDGLLTVHARATAPNGRTDEDFGVVAIAGLRGDAAANAKMKAVTKAKRRTTLSICGLGFLDESELPAAPRWEAKVNQPAPLKLPEAPQLVEPKAEPVHEDPIEPYMIPRSGDDNKSWSVWCSKLMAYVRATPEVTVINEWTTINADELRQLEQHSAATHKKLMDEIKHQMAVRIEQDNDT